jgi:hypothetical protein
MSRASIAGPKGDPSASAKLAVLTTTTTETAESRAAAESGPAVTSPYPTVLAVTTVN